jgi:hypothetical protein
MYQRRRTQIRLAQRAYRQRKETTIASLKSQSSQLHSIIDQMNKAFLKLNQSTIKSGLLQLNPTLAQEFKLVTDTFASLIKTANEGQYEGDEEGEQGEQGVEGSGAPKLAEPEPEVQHIGWGYSTVPKPSAEKRPQPQLSTPDSYLAHISAAYGNVDSRTSDLVGCRQFGAGSVFDQSHRSSQPPVDPSPSHTSSEPTQLPFGLVDLLSQHQAPYATSNPHAYSVRVPTPERTPPTNRLPTPPPSKLPTRTLPPVTTYSFQETTFARRLSRAALEAGFHLLSNAHARPTVRFQLVDVGIASLASLPISPESDTRLIITARQSIVYSSSLYLMKPSIKYEAASELSWPVALTKIWIGGSRHSSISVVQELTIRDGTLPAM